MSRLFTIIDRDGVVVAANVTRAECFSLRGLAAKGGSNFLEQIYPALITPRKSQPYVWYAAVPALEIRSHLRQLRCPVVQQLPRHAPTGGWVNFVTPSCSGRRYEHNFSVSFGYGRVA